MILHLFYKEWLKTRAAFACLLILSICCIWHIFMSVENKMTMVGAQSYILKILYNDPPIIYYSILKYLPTLAGLIFALCQYLPEVKQKRYKLMLHLPVNNNIAVLAGIVYGLILLTILFAVVGGLFLRENIVLFPEEVTRPVIHSLACWFLGGYFVYNFIAFTITEPHWMRRIVYTITLIVISDLFLVDISAHGAYFSSVGVLTLLVLFSIPLVLYSFHRLMKGE